MRWLIVVAFLLSACEVPQPLNAEVEAPDGAEDAAAIVVAEWSERLGVELSIADLPPVRWFEGPCLEYEDVPARPYCREGGFSRAPGAAPEIHLVVFPTIASSALAHEALHWALLEIEGDPNDDHQSAPWSQVGEVCGLLAEADL